MRVASSGPDNNCTDEQHDIFPRSRSLNPQEDMLNKWMEKPKTAIDFDYRFQRYHRCIREVDQLPQQKDIGCIHLNTEPLAEAAVAHAREWISLLARKLASRAAFQVRSIYTEMMVGPFIFILFTYLIYLFIHVFIYLFRGSSSPQNCFIPYAIL